MNSEEENVWYRNVNEGMLVSNVKRHLMSRDDKQKLEAVQFLLLHLESLSENNALQNVCDNLIEADLVEYLGEAMATQDSELLRIIFKCLEMFLVSKKLSTQVRAAYIIECIQRTLYFLFKHSNMVLSTANAGLKLLAECIEEFNKNLSLTQLFGNDANISQVFVFVASLLKNKEEFGDEVIINASLVLFSLFSQNDPALADCNILCEISDVIRRSLASLAVLCNLKGYQEIRVKIMMLMVKIGIGALRFCMDLTYENENKNNLESESHVLQQEKDGCEEPNRRNEASKKILSCVVSFMHNMWIPHIVTSELDTGSSELFYCILQCIEYLYCTEGFNIVNFSEDLAKSGFTILLPFTLNWASERQLYYLRKICEEVMVDYITCLSEKHLRVSNWLESTYLKLYLIEGIRCLPERFSNWLNILEEQNVPESSKHFVIIFFYFFCLFLPSLPSRELHLNILLSYLTSLSGSSCPVPVIKAFWFLYTEAVLCQTSTPSIEILCNSTDILLKLLETAPCAQLYTHHPAILFWSFSSPRIPLKFQFSVMCLWLEKEDDETYDTSLVKMALTSEDVVFCLLEVLKHSNKQVSSHAATVLGKAIKRQKETRCEGILSLLWDTLPNVLAEFYSENSHMKGHNIAYYMQVVCTEIPPTPNSKLLLQCGIQVMKVLMHLEKTKDICVEARAATIQMALMILIMAMNRKDQRVLLNYINQMEFVKLVYHTSGHISHKLIRPSIQLLMKMNKYFIEMANNSQKKGYTFQIDVRHMLYMLIQDDYDILICTLHFLYDLMTSELINPPMEIVTGDCDFITSPFLQILFRRQQNICSKSIPDVSRNSFKAMGSVLHYAFKIHPKYDLYGKLATQPWTHTMLQIFFMNKKPEISIELLFFLCWWFHFYILKVSKKLQSLSSNICEKRKSRAPYPSLLSRTAERVGKALVDVVPLKNPRTNRLALTVMHRILLLDASVSENITQSLRTKLTEENFEVSARSRCMF